jgi:hypothetical protein
VCAALDATGLGWDAVAGYCEHRNETLGSMKVYAFLNQLRNTISTAGIREFRVKEPNCTPIQNKTTRNITVRRILSFRRSYTHMAVKRRDTLRAPKHSITKSALVSNSSSLVQKMYASASNLRVIIDIIHIQKPGDLVPSLIYYQVQYM